MAYVGDAFTGGNVEMTSTVVAPLQPQFRSQPNDFPSGITIAENNP